MIRTFAAAIFFYAVFLLFTGAYVAIVYFFGHFFWPEKAAGSLIYDKNGQIRGSYLLAQNLPSEYYFMPRPSGKNNSTCDLALYNTNFKTFLKSNYLKIQSKHQQVENVIMLAPSASGLDPYITVDEAKMQAVEIAKKRNVDIEYLNFLIEQNSLKKTPPFFQLDIVNTTILNTELENQFKELRSMPWRQRS